MSHSTPHIAVFTPHYLFYNKLGLSSGNNRIYCKHKGIPKMLLQNENEFTYQKRQTNHSKNIFRFAGIEKVKMRRVILLMHMSLDGFVAGRNGEMNWITIDDEIFKDANELATTADVALYGRNTYQMMASYWPSVLANSNSTALEVEHALWMENVRKIVFSTTLENAEWNNTRLIKQNITEEVIKLKHKPGRNMIIFGSPCLTHSFMERGLIDEYRININPVVLGGGVPLFKKIQDRVNLKLSRSMTFHSGVVGLLYESKNG